MEEKKLIVSLGQQIHTDMQRSIPLTEGMSLYRALQKEGIALSAPCAGNGTCGACKIKVSKGSLPVTEKDRKLLSEEQLKEGWRLACQAYPQKACEIYVPTEQFSALTAYEETKIAPDELKSDFLTQRDQQNMDAQNEAYAIAIDLGTTTVAYELFDLGTGKTIKIISTTNPQRIYGADVVSRIDQSENGRSDMLRLSIRQGMKKDIAALTGDIDPEKIDSIGISGNMAMVHLLMGYSCEGLGRYPFTPITRESIHTDALQMGIMEQAVPVFITGGISAYVGGDILAGLTSQNFLMEKTPSLFIDLGTNAEIALTDGHGNIYVTSAPAGPAFEAANISCGVGSIEGAISSIDIEKEQQTLITIGGKEPVGFCGSGILEAVYELLKNDFMDETGLLADAYFEHGFPVGELKITQQDIRQIQLAKSAVFSAVHILMQKAEMTPAQLDRVCLAGGFGCYLNVEKAVGIGLLADDFLSKIRTLGNTSLYGTKQILRGVITEVELEAVQNACEEIYLSVENDFQDVFMENMNFKKPEEG